MQKMTKGISEEFLHATGRCMRGFCDFETNGRQGIAKIRITEAHEHSLFILRQGFTRIGTMGQRRLDGLYFFPSRILCFSTSHPIRTMLGPLKKGVDNFSRGALLRDIG